MDIDELRAVLAGACEKAGGQSAWAKSHGLSAPYISDILKKRREPGPQVLDALGFERIITYRAKEAHHDG